MSYYYLEDGLEEDEYPAWVLIPLLVIVVPLSWILRLVDAVRPRRVRRT